MARDKTDGQVALGVGAVRFNCNRINSCPPRVFGCLDQGGVSLTRDKLVKEYIEMIHNFMALTFLIVVLVEPCRYFVLLRPFIVRIHRNSNLLTVCLGSTNKLCLCWKLKHVNLLEMT